MDMMDERPGDAVVLYELEEGEPCPVCNASLPPFQYCPTCGSAWAENGTNIETHLADMQQEASRNIKNPDASEASRLAWYWSHIGSIDLARQLDLISEKRRRELYEEMRPLKPAITVPVDFQYNFCVPVDSKELKCRLRFGIHSAMEFEGFYQLLISLGGHILFWR